MSGPTLIPAAALTVGFRYSPETDITQEVPIVAWACTSDGNAVPVTPGNIHVHAVRFAADDQVLDLTSGETYGDFTSWIEHVQESPPEEAQEETPTLRDLGISGRACVPLEKMGVTSLATLAVQSRDDIAAVKGVSKATMQAFDRLLTSHGLAWDFDPETVSAEKPETAATPDDDDMEVPL